MTEELKTPLTELEKPPTSGALARPDYLRPGDATGTEHLTRDDLQLPRLALAQKISYEIEPTDSKFIPGLKEGDMFNNLTKQIYGPGPLELCVVSAYPPRWVEFIPRKDGGGIRDFNVPAGDPRTQFGPNGEQPLATKFYDYVVLLLPTREMIAFSFKSTGLKVARGLNALIAMRNAPCYAGKYTIGTVTTKNAKGIFKLHTVQNSDTFDGDSASEELPGWVSKDLFAYAAELHRRIAGKTLVTEREPGDEEDLGGGTASGGEETPF